MAFKIGTTTYNYLRDAINSAVSEDTIFVEQGIYDISTSPNYTPGVPNASITSFNKFYGSTAYSLSRFFSSQSGISGLTIKGAGAATTAIVNLNRIYNTNLDSGLGLPTRWTICDLTLNFNSPGTSAPYILQTGNATNSTAAVTSLTLKNLTFDGVHGGSRGSSGAYCVLFRADNLLVDGIRVETLTGQQGYTRGTTTAQSSGGSAFLQAQGNDMIIRNSTFKEAGFRNSLTIFGSSNVLVENNTFDGDFQLKSAGQVLSDSTATIQRNTFKNGTYLDLEQVNSKAVAITSNAFDGATASGVAGIVIRENAGSLSQLANVTATGNTFKDVVPFQSLVAAAASGPSTQLMFGSNTVINPISGAQTWQRFIVGGTANDFLSGATGTLSANDFIIGGPGNDSLVGNGGNDAFVFTAAPGTVNGNVDSIRDFNGTGLGTDKIWLDDAVFTTLSKGALNGKYGTYINFDGTDSVFYDTQGTGSVVENGTTVFKVFELVAGSRPSLLSQSSFVVF